MPAPLRGVVRTTSPQRRTRAYDPLRAFLHGESAGGVALAIAAVAAVVWANSPWAAGYTGFWGRELSLGAGPLTVTEDLQHWVNDGLMALFFFVVGLEIKRELVTGDLRERRAAALPGIAAVGGVLLPAAIFLALTWGSPGAAGWGIPMATDIAFAVGVLALLGKRVPAGAKLFLLTVAIVDDIIAIGVIAIAYTSTLSFAWLAAAGAGLLAVVAMQRTGVTTIWAYVLPGVFVWWATLESGVHATIAGVALGLLTPARPVGGRRVLEHLEHRLHPVSAFLVVPLFALANAGIPIDAATLRAAAAETLPWAVVLGLVVGKLVGIAGATTLALRWRVGVLPAGMSLHHVWGAAALGGIGFTVSLFITELAYTDPALVETAKLGVFAGSLIAGVLGAVLLRRAPRPDAAAQTDQPDRLPQPDRPDRSDREHQPDWRALGNRTEGELSPQRAEASDG